MESDPSKIEETQRILALEHLKLVILRSHWLNPIESQLLLATYDLLTHEEAILLLESLEREERLLTADP